MRRLHAGVVFGLVASTSPAFADDETPAPFEVGAFGGGFITNYYHQFYELEKFPRADRPLLQKVSPLFGVRAAYFIKPWLGIEGELSAMMTNTLEAPGMPAASATIYSGHAQFIFQLPDLSPYVVPFVTLGDGFMHTSSDYLGSDTDGACLNRNRDQGYRDIRHRVRSMISILAASATRNRRRDTRRDCRTHAGTVPLELL